MNVKNLILGIGIVIIYGLVLWQGIEAFYPSPEYEDYCTAGRFDTYYPTKPLPAGQSCEFPRNLQDAQNQCYADKGQPVWEYDNNGCQIALKECDYCQREYDEADKAHAKVVFIIAVIIGIITLLVGFSLLSTEPVGSALIGSGIWAIFWGSVANWRNFSNIWRFLLLLVSLVLIVWFTLRLNKPRKRK